MRKTMLIVEEDDSILLDLYTMVRALPYDALLAQSVKEAVELAVARRPAAILMDARLPDLTAVDMLDGLRAAGFGDVPVVMINAPGHTPRPDDGVVYRLYRPVPAKVVRNAIRQAVGDPA